MVFLILRLSLRQFIHQICEEVERRTVFLHRIYLPHVSVTPRNPLERPVTIRTTRRSTSLAGGAIGAASLPTLQAGVAVDTFVADLL